MGQSSAAASHDVSKPRIGEIAIVNVCQGQVPAPCNRRLFSGVGTSSKAGRPANGSRNELDKVVELAICICNRHGKYSIVLMLQYLCAFPLFQHEVKERDSRTFHLF